jgi:thioredoxin reductase (NADPH)
MSQYLVDRIAATENITVLGDSEITAVQGSGHFEGLDIVNARTGKAERLEGAALFIFIGVAPRTEAFASFVATDEKGFILTGNDARAAGRPWGLDRDPLMFETSVPGVFAAGDVRANANRRIAAAVGEGSAAIFSIHQYLRTV